MNTYQEVLDRLIHDELPRPSTYDEFAAVVNDIKNETDRMKRNLPMIRSTKGSHEELEMFIHSMQRQLLVWMETVYAYLPEQEQRRLNRFSDVPALTDGYKKIYNYFEDVLQFIQRHFTRYIDISCMIPASRLMEAQDKVTESLALIEQGLGKSDIDPICREIIMKPLYHLIATDAAAHTVTYEKLLYLNELHTGLTDLFTRYSDDNISQKLRERLIYLNFNDPDYYTYVTESIMKDAEENLTSIHKLVLFYEFENEYDQLLVKPGISYIPEEKCLKEELREWITKRIEHIKRTTEILQAPVLPVDFAKFLAYKIFVDMSIEQVSYIVNVLYDKEIIGNDVTKKSIMEFVTYFITTKNGNNLSVKSAINKMYNPGAALVDSVRSLVKYFLTITSPHLLLLIPLTELIIRMAQNNASVTCLTLALLFLAHFIYDFPRQSAPFV